MIKPEVLIPAEGKIMPKLTIKDLDVHNRQVLMRVDFNVPLENGNVADDKRIRAAVPTILHILKKGGKLILMSHLGRPKGRPVPEMSLRPCVEVLASLIGKPVFFVDDCIGSKVETAAEKLLEGQVLLLENVRYHKEETDNDDGFARKLAGLGDLFVNDAFGTAHRAHASTVGVTRYMDACAAGYLIEKEIAYLGQALKAPKRPFVAILGGAKISGKIDVIANLLPKVDKLIIGGGMAFTFMKAKGFEIGDSLLEADKVALAARLLEKGKEKIVLPDDVMVSDQFDFKNRKVGALNAEPASDIAGGFTGLDIGPLSIERFAGILDTAGTVVWNGPMGVFELDQTAKGTFAIAQRLAEATDKGAITIVGGGDSASAVQKANVAQRISHVSTGGGACLEFLEGKDLPGVAALTEKE